MILSGISARRAISFFKLCINKRRTAHSKQIRRFHIHEGGFDMRIITISRQFGSGGRELGKRLADHLGWDYYDREIISRLAESEGLDQQYIENILIRHEWSSVPLTFRNSFSPDIYAYDVKFSLLMTQRKIIEDIAAAGNDCIIVGRDADIILSDKKPFRIFICADMEARLARCMKFEEKKPVEERLSEREIKKNIKKIDKARSNVREMLTGKPWGDSTSFDLSVNTAQWDIKNLPPVVAEFALKWFEVSKK